MRWGQFEPLKPRLLASVVLAGLVSACSSDVARFGDNPFQNPFTSRTSFDPASTASINRNVPPQAQRLQAASASTATTQPLPAPNQPMMRAAAPLAASRITAPASTGSVNTGSVASAAYPALAPVAPRATTALGSNQGWTAVGGTPVTMQQGETLSTISGRYGVPVSALLAVNGLSSANAAKPGQQIMIPAYNAVQGSAASAPRVASASPMIPSRETITDAPKAVAPKVEAPKASVPKMEAPKAPAPRNVVRDVAPRVESDAEKRAAAKLKQLRQQDDDEDEAPAAPSRAAPKVAAIDKAAVEKSQTEKARLEAQRKADELKKADAERKREAAAKIAAAKKQAQEETTASIPAPKVAARAIERAAPAVVEAPTPPAEQADASAFRWPAQGKVINGFGGRSASGPNDGINISVPEGTPIKAAEGGTVIHADDALKGYGKLVLVRHANGLVTVYAHNSDIKVKRGENVRRGQVIAASGSSGNVTSPQLHFQIRKGAQALDPMKHLASN
ncbi:MAG: peptidoglycan DD-metalloendopeptidase family protein [Rhabdaerophilum sp.]